MASSSYKQCWCKNGHYMERNYAKNMYGKYPCDYCGEQIIRENIVICINEVHTGRILPNEIIPPSTSKKVDRNSDGSYTTTVTHNSGLYRIPTSDEMISGRK